MNQSQINRTFNIIKEMKNTKRAKYKTRHENSFNLTESLRKFFNKN